MGIRSKVIYFPRSYLLSGLMVRDSRIRPGCRIVTWRYWVRIPAEPDVDDHGFTYKPTQCSNQHKILTSIEPMLRGTASHTSQYPLSTYNINDLFKLIKHTV